jgi:hypothetical protein
LLFYLPFCSSNTPIFELTFHRNIAPPSYQQYDNEHAKFALTEQLTCQHNPAAMHIHKHLRIKRMAPQSGQEHQLLSTQTTRIVTAARDNTKQSMVYHNCRTTPRHPAA